MTRAQEKALSAMREKGMTYRAIAEALGVKAATVRSFFARKQYTEEKTPDQAVLCDYCRMPIPDKSCMRSRRFCSDLCRHRWWNAHQASLSTAAAHRMQCACCGCSFISWRPARYCSRACYFSVRYGGGGQHE